MYIPGVYAQIHIHLFSLQRNIHIYLNYYPELTKDRFILYARVCVRSCSCIANAINNITKDNASANRNEKSHKLIM